MIKNRMEEQVVFLKGELAVRYQTEQKDTLIDEQGSTIEHQLQV